ncbi:MULTISPECIES: 4-hydroxythreonine-4-phosphate dehydrogenase PdxA [Methylosinus]|uniref:4-hydroxythreonine-4-phosphate dehydrogenase n=1 Tax=Methylosinus trichosporium (strain ATCC 35070 / NCIMB 11131 / UNIQEM 75 / OB3b) TaxID=595536 RepID=A0A2D2D0D5_METT3|nr:MULTISPECIES: 4-hydroxythreonine-4-phosphate dehydrogenase PdxA [Methylosinus]ATQ68404.1 4-hydroxythreonine-4-phosphate dehydrogenase PdxA [Methylosinus trichosporium OB3b]OBS51358.1 4-hydroxythreonine-4-phosphate dehydrogenase PdxA [Methylosinus sp. 3S-1]
MSATLPPLALTQGDPSGIGPELALKAWRARDERGLPPFFVLADPDHLARTAAALGLEVPLREATPSQAAAIFPQALPVAPLGRAVRGAPGAPDPEDAAATILSIERAVELATQGEASALVTNPIAKNVLYAAGFAHPGHTEFLAALAERRFGRAFRPVMMLWAEELAVVPATIHVALAEVPRLLTRALLVETGAIVAADLSARFGIAAPRLAFAGLNPHAGESGAMGREEIEVIAPAVAELRACGVDASGPHPADTMFHAAARARYDVAICPTHDQALIPIKTLAFDRGVNVTLGLPFVRTSPDHGTAFDIAGRGIADATSLIEAIRLADRMTAR